MIIATETWRLIAKEDHIPWSFCNGIHDAPVGYVTFEGNDQRPDVKATHVSSGVLELKALTKRGREVIEELKLGEFGIEAV